MKKCLKVIAIIILAIVGIMECAVLMPVAVQLLIGKEQRIEFKNPDSDSNTGWNTLLNPGGLGQKGDMFWSTKGTQTIQMIQSAGGSSRKSSPTGSLVMRVTLGDLF